MNLAPVEALYLTTELHTSSVRVRVQPGTKYLYGKKSVGMYVVWLSPSGRGGFTGISRECRDMSWLSSTSGSSVSNTQQWGWRNIYRYPPSACLVFPGSRITLERREKESHTVISYGCRYTNNVVFKSCTFQYFCQLLIARKTELKTFGPRQANLCLRAFRHDTF